MKDSHREHLKSINLEIKRVSTDYTSTTDIVIKKEKMSELIKLYESKAKFKRLTFGDKMALKIFKKIYGKLKNKDSYKEYVAEVDKRTSKKLKNEK